MIPIIKICSLDSCKIVVTDLTQDSDEYIPEDSDNLELYYQRNRFKYSETLTINILQKNKFDSSEIIQTTFTDHCSHLDEQYLTLDTDGYYTIHHIILPTTDWLENNISLKSDLEIYVTDGQKIYHYKNKELHEVESQVIAEINNENTTISRVSSDQFSICHLFNCYIKLCKGIFEGVNLRCINKNKPTESFSRDFLWMTINVIKYHIEKNEFLEAQRILEMINYCNGFCQNDNFTIKSSGCGCKS